MSPTYRKSLGLLLATFLLTGCASGSRIVSNMDPSADFTQYRTFGFMQPLGTDNFSNLPELFLLVQETSAPLVHLRPSG